MGLSKLLFELSRRRKGTRVVWTEDFKEGDHVFNLIMKPEQAENLLDFLEATFAEGIGSDPDCKGLSYVENIRSVYMGLKRVVK